MPRRRIYLDNAATSFPKPPEVLEAMVRYATDVGVSPGRGAYAEVREADRIVRECRELICRLMHGADPDHVIFTLNATDALNLAIKGLVSPHRRRGEPVHLVTTWMDHNSVLRPYHALRTDGAQVTHLGGDPRTGTVTPDQVDRAIRADTRVVAVVHGSNVTGAIQPIAEIGAVCRRRGVPLLVDAAQTLGHCPVNVEHDDIDLLAFPGHKGLLGPLGTGGLYIRPGLEARLDPLREGGTGSNSEQDVQPAVLPDKYEPGSPNAIGIAGLAAGVRWILDRGVETLRAHEANLVGIILDAIDATPGVRVLGPAGAEARCGVVAITVDGMTPEEVSATLDRDFGVLTRSGLHCAPGAHRMMNTTEGGGATRLSVGPFLTADDARHVADAVHKLGSRTLEGAGA
ncbi:MAG: aminotransferase class V-fold PLP-dependent enzyme [Planctomycetes bacterium]|nr:aminotransferase class V-fold PLP-dependent enzyme [Planctomycetota bacterium]